jgi:pyruvate-formate lyase-activating enzyme
MARYKMTPSYDFANILLSGPCNLRCPYCIGQEIDPRFNQDTLDVFPPRNLDRFIRVLCRHNVRQVVLTGTNTDPQLYRHEARLVALLRERLTGAQLSLHTNGLLAVKKMAVLNRYDRVSLSFPSFDPDTYEHMTGSRHGPDLVRILREARVPVKISCIVNEHNIGELDAFLARCRELGIRRVVLRQLYGDTRAWDILPGRPPVSTYRNNPVYNVDGMEVTYWRFEDTTSTSLNLFSDGTISTEYLLSHSARLEPGSCQAGFRTAAGGGVLEHRNLSGRAPWAAVIPHRRKAAVGNL